MEDFFLVAVLARGIAAELQWSDMKRKHGRREKDIINVGSKINPPVCVLGISRAITFPIAMLAHHGKI
jgi:hypothetical protein